MLGEMTIWYLFLAGAGAGALLGAAVLEFLTPYAERCAEPRGTLADHPAAPFVAAEALRPFFGPAYGAGLAAVLLGMFCLMADLGRPDRLLDLFLSPSLSFISVGAYLLLALVLCAALSAAAWSFGVSSIPRWLAGVARVGLVASALAVMAYTGLFLASLRAILFWYSPWLPALFAVSALSTGLGLLAGAVAIGGAPDRFATTLRRVQRVDAVAIVAEALLLAALLITALAGDETARASAQVLLVGPLAPTFWLFVVVIGLGVPLVGDLAGRADGSRLMLLATACLLMGGFFLRWCVVRVGTAPDVAAFVAAAFGMG